MQPGPRNRLSPREVERLERVLGGDPLTEEIVLRFISARYGARNLFFLPAGVAAEALRRPGDFLRAAKLHSQPELSF